MGQTIQENDSSTILKHLTPLTLKKICQELDINLPYPFSEEKLFCGISLIQSKS